MFIRFNRSAAIREAFRRYDAGRHADVVRYCTAELAKSGADPELRVLRGVAYLDRGRTAEAVADWEACGEDLHVGPIADYYLGNFLATRLVESHDRAFDLFRRAAERGWAEGHTGMGMLLLTRGCRLRDEASDTDAAAQCFREAVAELTVGATSPAVASRARAVGLRASAHYNLGDMAATERDVELGKTLVDTTELKGTDPRATGTDLFA